MICLNLFSQLLLLYIIPIYNLFIELKGFFLLILCMGFPEDMRDGVGLRRKLNGFRTKGFVIKIPEIRKISLLLST